MSNTTPSYRAEPVGPSLPFKNIAKSVSGPEWQPILDELNSGGSISLKILLQLFGELNFDLKENDLELSISHTDEWCDLLIVCPNPNYESELAIYEEKLAQYKQDMNKWQAGRKDFKRRQLAHLELEVQLLKMELGEEPFYPK